MLDSRPGDDEIKHYRLFFIFPLRFITLFRFERCLIFLPLDIIWLSDPILNPPDSRLLSPPKLPPLSAFIMSRLRLNVFTRLETAWT